MKEFCLQENIDICGLDWEPQVLNFHETKRAVATASALQVREKMYQGSSEVWRKYAPLVPELFEGLPQE